jgi:hypothetical protein
MPYPIVNSIISWFLKKRKHQMELFLKYPIDVQEELLHKLVEKAQGTEIGKKYQFSEITTYAEFARNVPIQQYESIEHLVERTRKGEQNVFWPTPIKWFAKSSGTTNSKSKFIPVSEEALEDCHFKAGKDMLCLYSTTMRMPSFLREKVCDWAEAVPFMKTTTPILAIYRPLL